MPAPPSRTLPRRKGLTFLEVMVSLAVLGLTASMIFGGVAFVEGVSMRDRHRLNAAEVAHRIVLQYMDDSEKLRGQPNVVEQGGFRYVFKYEDSLLLEEREEGATASRRTAKAFGESSVNEMLTSRITQLKVTVWVANRGRAEGPPLIELVRIYDAAGGPPERTIEWLKRQLKDMMEQR
ncbi:MAG: prepilin-type N-terminal cleavage/methylation domain-containing protein [Phycisphaerales bacterium]|nr:prepilin-type N-terminal cleavage/methylation domain-containing protein [Phycisphaerales bacterium]